MSLNSNRWNPNTEPNPMVVKIIWFSLMSSVGIHYYVGCTLDKVENPDPQMKMILAAMAVMPVLISFFFRQKALKTAQDQRLPKIQKANQVFIFSIISWALSESVSVLGLVTRITTADETYANGLYATAIAMLFFYWPISVSSNNPQDAYRNDYKQ